jgi:hypothetical protein
MRRRRPNVSVTFSLIALFATIIPYLESGASDGVRQRVDRQLRLGQLQRLLYNMGQLQPSPAEFAILKRTSRSARLAPDAERWAPARVRPRAPRPELDGFFDHRWCRRTRPIEGWRRTGLLLVDRV